MKTRPLLDAQHTFLEKHIPSAQSQNTQRTVDQISKRKQSTYAPLSCGQQQMWLLSQLIPDIPVYNESVLLRIPGPLDVDALEKSLNAFIERHDIWRTTFPAVDGQPVQMVHAQLKLHMSVFNVQTSPVVEREREAVRIATEQARPTFDLTELPLLRATLIHVDDDDHRLYLTLHHMLFDGTIYEVFVPELSMHYAAIVQGKSASLPPLPLQYADFAAWQRECLQGDLWADQLTYWKQQLAHAPMLELPTDQPRLAQQTYNGHRLGFSLSVELVDALKQLGRSTGATLDMVLVATFNVLLQRYSGQDDILVGSTTEDHTHREMQRLIGLFANTLVLRTDLSGNPTFLDLLGRVRDVIQDANMHRDIPFEYLVRELNVERDTVHNPLIQALIMFRPALPVWSSDWTIAPADVEINRAKCDLSLELDDRPHGLQAWLEYNTDVWKPETAQRMVDHWRTMLEAVVADPTQHIADLPLLTDAEREQLLVTWNDTAVTDPGSHCLHKGVEKQVEHTPDAVAVIFEDTYVTYQELNQRANLLARRLHTRGVGPDVLVGVCMERSVELIVALLAILKAGGAYVPLDPDYPRDRLAYMIADAHVSLVLTQKAVEERVPLDGVQILSLNATEPGFATELEAENLDMTVHVENLAYMIYTSGSTGRPKGVMIDHRSFSPRLHWLQQTFRLQASDVVMNKTTFSFDPSVWEFFWPLSVGARLFIVAPHRHTDHQYLLSLIQQQQVSVLNFSPLALSLFVQEPAWKACQSMRLVMCGGEALSLDVAERFYANHTRARLVNIYGPTEATIFATAWLCDRNIQRQVIPIGRPVAETEMYLLDKQMQPVPIGVVGELYIGSKADNIGLARGYFHRPDLTAERFVPHPFSQQLGAQLYRTGDLACYRKDGTIEFLGRIDQQIKLRGFRIELGEIEAALQQQQGIQQALVILREDIPDDKRLVAYLIAYGEPPTREALRTALKEVLPDYMVPTVFVFMDAFPLTPNGKVSRQTLPVPDMSRIASEVDNYVEPSEIMHYQLLSIWEELLAVRPIGIQDNFFYLGGHSLLAAHLVVRIEQVFGKKISLSTLFAEPTIEDLTRVLQQQTQSGPRSPLIPVQITGSKKPFFFLHGDWTGGAYYCFTLARHAGLDQPFYVLEPFVSDDDPGLPTIESLAASYIKLICSVQPEGPYELGGYCNGGVIAYEIAQQLQCQGEQVDFLALVDPASESSAKNFVYLFERILHLTEKQQWGIYLHLRHIYIRKIRPMLLQLSHTVDDQLLQGIKMLVDQDQEFTRWFPPIKTLRKDYDTIFSWALQHYKFKPYRGKATYIWDHESLSMGDRDFWSNNVQINETESHEIPGTHYGILVDDIQSFAECLGASLKKVQEHKVMHR